MIEAIIFDCFGVLAGDGWLPFKHKYFAHNPEIFKQATDLNKQVDAGLMTFDDFIGGVAEMAQMSKPAAYEEIERNPVDVGLFDYIAVRLKPNYKIGMLSNAGADWLSQLFTSNQRSMFDATCLSFETGIIKPNSRAYEIIAERLGVPEASCVFIDDQERYCQGAEEVGMQAIHYKDLEQLKVDLEAILAK